MSSSSPKPPDPTLSKSQGDWAQTQALTTYTIDTGSHNIDTDSNTIDTTYQRPRPPSSFIFESGDRGQKQVSSGGQIWKLSSRA